jgi:mono/diheme cytochrome c family protein
MPNLLPFAIAVSALWSCAAGAPESDMIEAGHKLVRQECSACHLVEEHQFYALSFLAPSFFEVAADPAITEKGLRTFLSAPHENMPKIALSEQQINEIIAYIFSLRADPASPSNGD